MSVHLACLADCGYVACRRAGRNAFYRVADPRVADLVVLAHALAADNTCALVECEHITPPPAIDPDPLHHCNAQSKPEGFHGQP